MSAPPEILDTGHGYLQAVAFTPDGRALITAGMDGALRTWSVADWTHEATLEGHEKSANDVAVSPDGRLLVSGSSDGTVRLWSLRDGECLRVMRDRGKVVATVAFCPEGELVGAGHYGGRVAVWDSDGRQTAGFAASDRNLTAVEFSPAGDGSLATAGLGPEVSLWSVSDGKSLRELPGHETVVLAARFLDGGDRLASLDHAATVRYWEAGTATLVREHPLEVDGPRGMVVSPDETALALAAAGRVELRARADLELRRELAMGVEAVHGLAFSPAGDLLVAGGADGRLRIWDLP